MTTTNTRDEMVAMDRDDIRRAVNPYGRVITSRETDHLPMALADAPEPEAWRIIAISPRSVWQPIVARDITSREAADIMCDALNGAERVEPINPTVTWDYLVVADGGE